LGARNRYEFTDNQAQAPLIPKVNGPGDTRHFQSYEEARNIFKISAENLHATEFEEF
jgi:hypothetical protein